MNGIYLTSEARQKLNDKITECRKLALNNDSPSYRMGQNIILLEILESAITLPVEESWEDIKDMLDINTLPIKYKNGVIISK